MSYQKFTLTSFEKAFSITAHSGALFPNTPIRSADGLLQAELEENIQYPMLTEKARSEYIISPILRFIRRSNPENLTLFSGYELKVDKARGLTGYCDYLFSQSSVPIEVKAPIICLTEAKRENLDAGVGQCAAEMLAARIFNEQQENNVRIIHGAVTSGTEWLFLRLEGEELMIDTHRYSLANLPELLGALQTVIDFYKP
ncbi:MAG: hypothetical protein ACOVSW_22570 [Candidatus Kapaibacteriota bacterium]|jgi:hypothetical protein